MENEQFEIPKNHGLLPGDEDKLPPRDKDLSNIPKTDESDWPEPPADAPAPTSKPAANPSDLVKDELPQVDVADTTWAEASEEEKKFVIREAMKEVIDPELMINVVDLGLLYDVHIDDDLNITLDMTLTSPACPLTDQIEWEAHAALGQLARSVTVNWVWLPPWTIEMITDEGREQLQAFGFMI